MTAQDIISAVKSLHLPDKSYVVFGSCPMALAGIRESSDIDMLITPDLFTDLLKRGWKKHRKAPGDEPIVYGVFEAHDKWNFSSYKPTLDQLRASATIVDGVPFAALEEVKKWKMSSARPKDLKDVELINQYLMSL